MAERAVKGGFATVKEPPNWHAIQEQARTRAGIVVRIGELPSLDFDLSEYKAADIERQRAAWLAERDRQAA